MTSVLLISDTHGHLDKALLPHIDSADEVWHAGDIGDATVCDTIESRKPFKAVFGNIDDQALRLRYPEEQIFHCESLKVYMTHIGGYPGKYSSRLKNRLKELTPQLFICGHSHILKVMPDKELQFLHINPGACGVHGFHLVKTAVRFEVHHAQIKNLAVIELGKRNQLQSSHE